jgi:hypothetical protein
LIIDIPSYPVPPIAPIHANDHRNTKQYVETVEHTETHIIHQPTTGHTRYLDQDALKKKLSTPTDFPEQSVQYSSTPIIKTSGSKEPTRINYNTHQ